MIESLPIPPTGTATTRNADPETYSAEWAPTRNEVLVKMPIDSKRGPALAYAVGARIHPRAPQFYFTPARAIKWHLLFMAGVFARRERAFGTCIWVFSRSKRRRMNLVRAVETAREVLAEQAQEAREIA